MKFVMRSFGSLAIVALAILSATPVWAQSEEPRFTLPDIQITIPGAGKIFTDPIRTTDCPAVEKGLADACYEFPWIGQYIRALYTFAVFASTVAAAIVIMIGGFLWLTAGGNTNQIGSAKNYISGAILGVSLMLGSYTILWLVNPDLVTFQNLRIPYIHRTPLREYVLKLYETGAVINDCSALSIGGAITSSALGGLPPEAFNDAGQTFGVNPIFLAAVAKQESEFGQKLESPKGAYGVMQIMPKTASDIWNNNRELTRPAACSGDDDPSKGSYTNTCKAWMRDHPTEVINMGAAYYRQIFGVVAGCGLGGNLTLAAAGYNAGPYRRDICNGDVPPIQETQDYVSSINGWMESLCRGSNGTVKKSTTPPGLEEAPDRTQE